MKVTQATVKYPLTIVVGSDGGLGISYTSLQQVGALLPSQAFGAAKVASYINLVNGNLMTRSPVFKQIERNFPVELSYFYNSLPQVWQLAHKRFKKLPAKPTSQPYDQTAILLEEDGHETTYTLEADRQNIIWWPPNFKADTPYLRYEETTSQWIWWDPQNHITEYYDATGRLMQRADAQGRATSYEYTDNQDSNRLTAVVGPSGTRYELRKQNLPGGGYQIAFCVKAIDSDQVQVAQFNLFDTSNRLTRTMILLDRTQTYYHVDYGYLLPRLTSITQSDGTSLQFGYDTSQPQRLSLFLIGGEAENAYTRLEYLQDRNTHLPMVTLQDAQGALNTCYLDSQNRITKLERSHGYPGVGEPLIPDTTLYAYDDQTRIQHITHPNGGIETFSYIGLESLLASHVASNGQRTDYSYDLTDRRHFCCCITRYDIQGKAAITRRVYDYANGNHVFLRFEISPEGRVTEYRQDGWGNVASLRHYLDKQFDVSGIPPTQAPSVQYVAQWTQSQLAQVSLTEYLYEPDRNAQILVTYQYGQINAEGTGDKHAPSTSKDWTIYDERGNLLQHRQNQYAPDSQHPESVTQQVFDGVNRLTSLHNSLNETTTHQYADSQRQVITTQPNGRIEIATYTAGGFTIQSEQTVDQQIRIEKCRRNAMGSPLLTTLADGRQVLTYYDDQFRLGYEVTQIGTLTERRHDQQKRFSTHIAYAKQIDFKAYLNSVFGGKFLPGVLELRAWMKKYAIPDSLNDRYTYEFFDLSDRLIYTVDAENYVVQTLYDAVDRPIAKIAYQAPLSADNLTKLKNGESIQLPFDASQDRCLRTFYDLDGLVIGEQDAQGYVTEYQRNGAGWVTHTILYATKQAIDLTQQDFTRVRPIADPAKDAHTYYFHNNRGLCEIAIDAEGYVTEMSYLAGGLLDKKVRHAQNLHETAPNWFDHPTIRPTSTQLPITTHEDAVTQYQYDLLDREISVLEANDNLQSQTRYNNMGQVLSQAQQDVTNPQARIITGDTFRGKAQQYDAWEQVIQEANPLIAEKLALVENNPNLNPAQKTAAKNQIWSQYSRRHTFDATGLQVKTVASIATDAEFAQNLTQDVTTYYYYDQARRPIVLITLLSNNRVTIHEDSYNAFGEVISSRRYSQHNQSLASTIIASLTGGFLPIALRQILNTLQATEDEVTQQARNKCGLVTQSTDADGYVATYQYDAFKACVQECLPISQQNSDSLLPLREKVPAGRMRGELIITHTFDVIGHETARKQQAADLTITTQREYNNPYGQQTNFIDAVGCQHKTAHDRLGRPVKQITLADEVEVTDLTVVLDAFARPQTQTDALGHATQFSYDRPQRTTVTVHPVEGTQDTIQTNGFHEVIKHTDALSYSQSTQHVADGQIRQHTDALGYVSGDAYNLAGWHTAHTDATGIHSAFSYDPAGELSQTITDTMGLRLTKTINRNALGRATSMTDARGIETKQRFDRRGNVTQQIMDPSGLQLITQHQYNGQSTRIQTQRGDNKQPNQYQHTYQQDGLNRAIGDTVDPHGLTIQHQQHLDATGKVVAEQDPEGNISRTYYNQRGQKRFVIDAQGGTQEWQYDRVGNVQLLRVYAKAITPQDLQTLTDQASLTAIALMVSIQPEDGVQYYFYDANNRERFAVSIVWEPLASTPNQYLGSVTEQRYNAASNVIQTIAYANWLDAHQIQTLTTAQLEQWVQAHQQPLQDRAIHFILDAAHQIRFTVDAEGYITEQRFTPTGKVYAKIAYSQALTDFADIDHVTPAVFYQRIHQDIATDRYSYTVFDRVDRVSYIVNGEGAVVHYTYDNHNNQLQQHRFANKITVPQASYDSLAQTLQSLAPDITQDRVTKKVYDTANRVIVETDALGHSDSYRLDAMGNVVVHMDRRGFYWLAQFDRANRLIKSTTPSMGVTSISKQENGSLTAKQAVNVAIITAKTYNKNNQLIQQVSAEGRLDARVVQMHYNANQQLIRTSLPNIPVDNGSPIVGMAHRPETLQTLNTQVLYDTQKRKIGFCDEGGYWTYYIRNNHGKIVYKITPGGAVTCKKRDAFGRVIRQIQYANAYTVANVLSLDTLPSWQDLSLFYQTHTSADDRITLYQRDRRGLLLQSHQGLVYDYASGLTNAESIKQLGSVHLVAASKQYRYDALQQPCYKSIQLNRHATAKTLIWYDRVGKQCVVAQSVGRTNDESLFKIDGYAYNTFGEEIQRYEYAQSLQQALTPEIAFSTLQGWLVNLKHAKDRRYDFTYYLSGKRQSRSRVDVVRQTAQWQQGQIPQEMLDVNYAALVESYQYDAVGNRIAVTREDGRTEYSYYNPLSIMIAQTRVPRNNLELTDTIIPFATFGVNAHGQTVLIQRYLKGAVNARQFPVPVGSDPGDQTELYLFDARGKQQIKQNGNGYPHASSYTANGQVAREWGALTVWSQDPTLPTKFDRNQQYIDVKAFGYDAFNRPNQMQLLRAAEIKQATYTVNNVFGEVVQEGASRTDYTIYRKFDTLGRVWLSNMTGVDTLYFYNLAGAEVLRIDSGTKAAIIRSLSYEQVPAVLDWSVADAEHTEKQRDLQGQIHTATYPASYVDNSHGQTVQPIPLNLYVGKLYLEIGVVSVSWPVVQEKTVVPTFYYWVSGSDEAAAKTLLIKTTIDGKRNGVDCSELITDRYQYRIDYNFTPPSQDTTQVASTIKQYESRGEFQVSTGHVENSQHCIPIVINNSTISFVGKTVGLTAVEVWQDGVKVGNTLPVSNSQIDLSTYPSGVYQFKPKITFSSKLALEQALSLPVSVLTHVQPLADQEPMAHEIVASMTLSLLTQTGVTYGVFNWTVPAYYQANSIMMVCVYKARPAANAPLANYTQQFTLNANNPRIPYTDKDGHELLSNFIFERPVEQLISVSLFLQEGSQSIHEYLVLYKEAVPLPLLQVPMENVIQNYAYPSKTILYITPWFNLSQAPQLKFLDTNRDRRAEPVLLQSTGYTSTGFTLDVSGFNPGYYPFWIAEVSGVFQFLQAGQSFPGDFTELSKETQQLVQPSRRYGYDRWHNLTQETNSLGHTTDTQYNDENKPLETLLPAVDVVNSDGSVTPNFRPKTRWGYDICGLGLGESNWNVDIIQGLPQRQAYTQLHLNDGVNVIRQVLADGVMISTQQYDSFNRIRLRQDSFGNTWVYGYDLTSNLLSLRSPEGLTNYWQYDEANHQIGHTNAANNSWRYNVDIWGNISESYQPLGNRTLRLYDHNRQLLQQTNADNSQLYWVRDYFGNIQTQTDLGGGITTYARDGKQRVIEQVRSEGYVGPYTQLVLRLESELQYNLRGEPIGYQTQTTYETLLLTPEKAKNQHLTYRWALGHCVEMTDQIRGLVSQYGVDVEGRRQSVVMKELVSGRILRQVTSQLDALGREIYAQDDQGICQTSFDGLGNRRHIQITIKDGQGNTVTSNETWWSYDKASRVLVCGLLRDQIIQAVQGAGFVLTYEQGRRKTERKYLSNGSDQLATLLYNRDGQVKQTNYSSGEQVLRSYYASGALHTYVDSADGRVVLSRTLVQDANGNLSSDDQAHPAGHSTTSYQYLPTNHLHYQNTDYHGGGQHDEYNYDYVLRGDHTVSQIRGRRYDSHRERRSVSTLYEGPNGEQNAVLGGSNKEGTESENRYFTTTPEGWVLERNLISERMGERRISPTQRESYRYQLVEGMKYFHSVNGEVIASYGYHLDTRQADKSMSLPQTDMLQVVEQHFYKPDTHSGAGDDGRTYYVGRQGNAYTTANQHIQINNRPMLYSVVQAQSFGEAQLGQHDWQSYQYKERGGRGLMGRRHHIKTGYDAGQTDNISSGATTYTVVAGDDYGNIAKKVYGDSNLGGSIAEANGGQLLQEGATITLPQLLPSFNGAATAVPYQILMNCLQGSIMPHVESLPIKKHHSFWGALLDLVTIAISVILAAPTGGMSLNLGSQISTLLSVTGEVGKVVITAAVAGVMDASLQGVLVGLGLQKHFSAHQIVDAAFAAAGTVWVGSADKLTQEVIRLNILKLGAVNVAEQLTQMALGQQRQFDILQVASVMAGAGLNGRLESQFPNFWKENIVGVNIVHTVSGTAINGVLRGQIDFEQMAAQLVGNQLMVQAQPYLLEGLTWADGQVFGVQSSQQSNVPIHLGAPELEDAIAGVRTRRLTIGLTDPRWLQQLGQLPSQTKATGQASSSISTTKQPVRGNSASFFKPGRTEKALLGWNKALNVNPVAGANIRAGILGFGKEGYNIVAGSINFGLSHPEILGALEGPVGKFLAIGIKVYNLTHSMPLQLPLMTIHAGAEEAGSLVFDVASLAIPLKGGLVRSGSTLLGRMFTGGMERFGFLRVKRISSESLPSFVTHELLESHFNKHSLEFNGTFTTPQDYLNGAHDVIKNGIKVVYEYRGEARIGYVRFMGTTEGRTIIAGVRNAGFAKFEFVGTNNQGNITTYFTPSGKSFWNIINNTPSNKNITPYKMVRLEENYHF